MSEVGAPPGFDDGGFGDVGEAAVCFQSMGKIMRRLVEIRDNVKNDSLGVEKHLKELAIATMGFAIACRRMFEQEHLMLIAMFSAMGTAGGGGGEERGLHKGIVERKIIII